TDAGCGGGRLVVLSDQLHHLAPSLYHSGAPALVVDDGQGHRGFRRRGEQVHQRGVLRHRGDQGTHHAFDRVSALALGLEQVLVHDRAEQLSVTVHHDRAGQLYLLELTQRSSWTGGGPQRESGLTPQRWGLQDAG